MPKVPRAVLKEYFQSGDKPTQPQFGTMLDSMLNIVDDRDLIGLRTYNPATEYLPGDCAVFNDQIVRCTAATTGVFNPAHWVVMNTFGSVTYISAWDAILNDPALQSSVGTKGFYYVVSNASPDPNDNTELDGVDDWKIGDWVIFNGSVWQRVDNSVAPPPASNVSYNPSGNLTATNVQGALDELEAEKQPLITIQPGHFPYADSTGLLTTSVLAQVEDGITLDLGKVISSETLGEGQISFGTNGQEVRLSTSGADETESRLQMTSSRTELRADLINIQENTSQAQLTLGGSNVSLSNDGGAQTDCSLIMQEGELKLQQAVFGSLIINDGPEGDGQTVLTGGSSDISLTSSTVSINNLSSGGSISLVGNGDIQVTGEDFIIQTDTVHIPVLTASTVPVVDGSQNLVSSTVTPAELENLAGVTSGVQQQLDAKLALAGGTMLGSLELNDDPTTSLGAATKQYVDDGDGALLSDIDDRILRTGDTMTGDLILNANPSMALGAVTKQYADAIETALAGSIAGKVSKAGDTMTGPLILNADPVATFGAATKRYADTIQSSLTSSIAGKVSKAGDTMTGDLILNADPVTALGASTKQYADAINTSLNSAKVNKAGDTMLGDLILNANPAVALGAVTKQYADSIQTALTSSIATKVSKGGDTMTGALVLNADPATALGAATKQYADAITTSLASSIAAKVSKAGDTMTGALILNADPIVNLGAATKQYADAITTSLTSSIAAKVSKAGDTMTGSLILNADPAAALGAATKQYADAITASLGAVKVSKAGDTMTGSLILNADPVTALGAATKQYADAIESALTSSVAGKVSKAGDAMTGLLLLSGDPLAALGAVTKQYADGRISGRVSRTGDTMTGDLILNADPTVALGAVTKQYADAIEASLSTGITGKVSKAGDTMTGALILNADPTATFGAATKRYVDTVQSTLTAAVAAKVSKAGDTMTGDLILNADPTVSLGAATKRYVDTIQTSLTSSIATKVNKAGDTMTGALVLNADPSAQLGAATKQYVDAATKKLLVPFTFTGEVITTSATFATIPLQITIPPASAVFTGATTITARLTIDYLLESGAPQALGEAGLTEWTTATASPTLVSGSSLTMTGTPDTWIKLSHATPFTLGANRTYRIIFRKTAGATGSRIRIEGATLTLFYA